MDVFTLIIMTAILMAFTSVALLYLRRPPYNARGALAWSAGSIAIAAGMALIAFRGTISDFWSIIVANVAMLYGGTILWHGFRQFLGRPVLLWATISLPLAVSPVLFWFTYHSPSFTVRTVAMTAVMAIIAAMIGRDLLRSRKQGGSRSEIVFGCIYLTAALFMAVISVISPFASVTDGFLQSNALAVIYVMSSVFILIFIVGVVTIVSARLINDLEEAKGAAEKVSRAKSEFLATMSHEIRTPLHGLMGMLQLLDDTTLNQDQKEYVRSAVASSARLRGLVDDVLDLSRVEAGKLDLEKEVFNPQQVLSQALLPLELLAEGKGLGFSLRFHEIPEFLIGDSKRLCQAILNLAGNAVKFTETGSVSITVGAKLIEATMVGLEIAVQDTGIGLSAAEQEAVFEKYFQTEGGMRKGGTGLGLAIARNLARLMGGDVRVESELGRGSVFVMHVQFQLPAPIDLDIYRKIQDRKEEVDAVSAARSMRILVADDFPLNRFFLQTLLAKYGHSVCTVTNGEDAVKALAEEAFDLVFMDVKMPVMDGLEATRRIRAFEDRKAAQVPIVALTAYAFKEERERIMASGMTACLPKPVSASDIIHLLGGYAVSSDGSGSASGGRVKTSMETQERAPAGIDRDYVLDLVDGDRDFLHQFLETTLASLPLEYEKLNQAFRSGDMETLQRSAHALKSAVSNFRDGSLMLLLTEMERAARERKPEAVRELEQEIAKRFSIFLTQVRTFQETESNFDKPL